MPDVFISRPGPTCHDLSSTVSGTSSELIARWAGTSYNVKLIVTGSNPVHLEAWLNGVQKIVFDDSSASQIATGVPGIQNYDTSVK